MDINSLDNEGFKTPLILAIMKHDVVMVRELLKRGADNNKGPTIPPIGVVLLEEYYDEAVFDVLLNSNPDSNMTVRGRKTNSISYFSFLSVVLRTTIAAIGVGDTVLGCYEGERKKKKFKKKNKAYYD